jgi:hypothetical protein
MRFIAGLIVGIVLTIGAAYIHDMNVPPAAVVVAPVNPPNPADPNATTVTPEATAPTTRRIVNWDVVRAITSEQSAWLRSQWNKIFN